MILVVLALVWVLALTPTLLRKLAERESTYSVAKFHRSLGVMRQAYPGMAAAAQQGGVVPLRAQFPPARSSGPSAKRRRQVLTILTGTVVATLIIGLLPAMRVAWDVSLIGLALTAGYVALLIHFRRVAVERSEKVVFIRNEPSQAAAGRHGLERREARPTPAVIGG